MMWINTIVCFICLYAVLAICSTLTTGLSNMLTMCQAAFYGIGAYVGVYLLDHFNVSFFVVGLAVMLATGLSSLLISYASIRLKGDSFVLATLGFQMMVFTTIWNWDRVTGGATGKRVTVPIKLLGEFGLERNNHWILMLAVLIVVILLFGYLRRTPYGRLLRAIRVDSVFVEAMGKRIWALKTQTFFLSAAFSGLMGLLYVSWMRYVDPTMLSLNVSILIVTALFFGGKDHWAGALFGSFFMLVSPLLFDTLANELPGVSVNSVTVINNVGQMLCALALILLMFYRPQGIIEGESHYRTKRVRCAPETSQQVVGQNSSFLKSFVKTNFILKLSDIYFGYTDQKDSEMLLNHVNVELRKGTITALVGGNGAGKTTLFNIISGIEKNSMGKIRFNGRDITKQPVFKRSQIGIARMFQGIELMPDLTLREYLVMSAQDHCGGENPFIAPFMARRIKHIEEMKSKRAVELLTRFFGPHQDELQRYLLKLDQKTSALSYGEQRLMAFIGLLMNIDENKETLLLLDEPTSGVNPAYIESMKELLRYYVTYRRVTVFLVEHKMGFVRDVADVVYYMDSNTGQLTEQLSPHQLMANDNFRKQYLGYV